MFLTLNFLTDWINNSFHHILLFLDSVVYWAASNCYQLFIKLASTRIFEDEFFANFAQRIYSILGIFMLFYLAYALLNAIVDPEKLAKGDKSVSKLASNLIISLVILGFLPSIFTYAYRVQNYVLSSNVIGALILGTPVVEVNEGNSNEEAMLRFGDVLSFAVLNTFLNSDNTNFNIGKTIDNRDYNWFDLKADILENGDYSQMPGMAEAVSNGAIVINANGSEGNKKVIDYKGFISTIVGLFLLYIMLSFTIDLGIRIFKFAFCQLIAPIPIIMRAVPGKKGTFDKYLKQTLAIYFEVFIRVACVYMAIYFIDAIYKSNNLKQFFTGGIQGMLAFVIVIMGILAGAKQLPKMISDFLGIETGGLKLGLTDKLKAGGFFAGGAMLGAGVTGLVRNGVAGAQNAWKNGKGAVKSFANGDIKSGLLGVGKTLWGGTAGILGSTFAGGASGMMNAYKSGKDAKGWGDMRKAAGAGAKASYDKRISRENYIAANNGVIGAMGAKFTDVASGVKEWATGTGLSSFLTQIDFKEGFTKEFDAYKNIYSIPEYEAMSTQLNHLKGLKASGATVTETGDNIDDAMQSLQDNMRNKRVEMVNKNKDAAAYVAYNLARYAKDNYTEFKKSGMNFNGLDVDDFILKGEKVYHKNGHEYSSQDLLKLFENLDTSQYTIRADGKVDIGIDPTTGKQYTDSAKAGLERQFFNAKIQLKNDKQSAAYKEAQKKKEAAQKK